MGNHIYEFAGTRRILVIKLRHIGDVLLSGPVFRALRHRFPEARITALVNAGTGAMLTGNPHVDEIIEHGHSTSGRLTRELELVRELRRRRFDMTISLTGGDRAAFLSYLSGASYRLAHIPGRGTLGKRVLYNYMTPNERGLHNVMKNLHLLDAFGISYPETTPKVEFFNGPGDEETAWRLLDGAGLPRGVPFIHIHPVSRWMFKCWPDKYMARVLGWLAGHGMHTVITSSPDKEETGRIAHILSLVPRGQTTYVHDLSGKTSLKILGAIAREASLFFGVDTAPMHIAAAVGTRVVALFGAGENTWAPWGEGHVVISSRGSRSGLGREEWIRLNLASIEPGQVEDALANALGLRL